MGRRSERLSKGHAPDQKDGDVIQVVSRAFDILRCFEGHGSRLGNLEISSRCGLPRSTVSRLTHTLTRMGQLVYLPRDQKYRIGPGAVALGTTMMRGLQLRTVIRQRLADVAERIPGTVGFVLPDRTHLVYLDFARAEHALGLHSSTGSRIAIARTAAGHAYAAALEAAAAEALIADIARDAPGDAKILRARLDTSRTALRERGYVAACGLWSEHINGIAAPLWSPHYQTYVVITIGVLSAMYDEARLYREVAPLLLELRDTVQALIRNVEGGFDEAAVLPGIAHKKETQERLNGVAAGTRRAGPARGVRARDGRRRQGQATA